MTESTEVKASWLTDELITRLKNDHGEIFELQHPEIPELCVIIKRPPSVEYQRVQSELTDQDRAHLRKGAIAGFVKRVVIYPQGEELTALLDKYAAFVNTIGNLAIEIIGQSEKVKAKKL